MSTKVLNKLVNVCTTLSGGTTSSGTSGTTSSGTSSSSTTRVELESTSGYNFSKYRLMEMKSDTFNTFEGVLTGTYTTTNDYFKVYMKLVSFDEILINPIFERLESTYTDHSSYENCSITMGLRKYVASDGTKFIGVEGFGFDKLTIDIITGDSDVITQADFTDVETITNISTDRNYQLKNSNGYYSFDLVCCSCCDFDKYLTPSS